MNVPAQLLAGQYNADGLMTIDWQAQMICYQMSQFAEPRGGYVKVLANMKHLWEEIFIADDRPRILICWAGERARGGFNQANTLHRVDRDWIVAAIRGHGFANLMAEGVGQKDTPGYIDPFYRDCQILRDQCRILLNITEEQPPDYKGMEPLPSIAPYGPAANVFLDGYAIKFSTANDIPAVTDIEPG